ncbi:MAG: hypothetical protein SGPRY_000181 [Prymnesium sp.]
MQLSLTGDSICNTRDVVEQIIDLLPPPKEGYVPPPLRLRFELADVRASFFQGKELDGRGANRASFNAGLGLGFRLGLALCLGLRLGLGLGLELGLRLK